MPDPYERHARNSEWAWGGNASRSQQRTAAANDDPVQPQRRGKRVRSPERCKASRDGLHHGEIILLSPADEARCIWKPYWRRDPGDKELSWWECAHAEQCTECGNILVKRGNLGRRCPAYPGDPGQKQAAEQETLRRIARPRQFRSWPVINGPQGYRKQKKKTK